MSVEIVMRKSANMVIFHRFRRTARDTAFYKFEQRIIFRSETERTMNMIGLTSGSILIPRDPVHA